MVLLHDDWYNFIEVENKQGIISAEECNEIINTLNYKLSKVNIKSLSFDD